MVIFVVVVRGGDGGGGGTRMFKRVGGLNGRWGVGVKTGGGVSKRVAGCLNMCRLVGQYPLRSIICLHI